MSTETDVINSRAVSGVGDVVSIGAYHLLIGRLTNDTAWYILMNMSKTAATTNTNAIAYYRVSTAKQGQSGLGLEAQKAAVNAYAEKNGLTIANEYTEVETGTRKRQRVEIVAAMKEAKDNDAVLLIAKLDRLARNVNFITGLMESGVKFVAVDMPHVDNFTIHILAAVAEKEAKQISERTKAALAAAAARGVVLGTPENLTDVARQRSIESRRAASKAKLEQAAKYAGKARQCGDSLRTIATDLNEMGHRTSRGKLFTAPAVRRMLATLG